ncbi:MAG: peptidase family protein [Paenibacillus sp.]|jgi:pimeloyl-ACP methyl ester carboxylesterase|nr:peptidase family protein [Paenibacillus sp.]
MGKEAHSNRQGDLAVTGGRELAMYEQYEDRERLGKSNMLEPFYSPYQDFRIYESSVTQGIRLGLNVIKPERPSYMLVKLHGWHMSMPMPERRETPLDSPYLIVQVDMRGRAFSEGEEDCNGYELIDIYDAVQFVRSEYSEYLLAPDPVYLEGGSGGGGNVLAAAAKFPDLFAAASAYYGISDYAVWYEQDKTGEFIDDMDIWIGCSPSQDEQRYAARSGLHLAANVITPLYIAHGENDIRIPVDHARMYVQHMARLGKSSIIHYDELFGVGGQGHQDHIREEQLELIRIGSERNRTQHMAKRELPLKGELIIGGYVYTASFQVHLESVHSLAIMEYDLETREARLTAAKPYKYRILWNDGRRDQGVCMTDV